MSKRRLKLKKHKQAIEADKPTDHPTDNKTQKSRRFYRSVDNRIIGGVCGGIADFYAVDPVVVRLLWIIGAIGTWGAGIILYLIMWLLVPPNPKHESEEEDE